MLSSTGQIDGHAMTKKPARRGRAKSSRNRHAAKRMTAENRIGTVAVHTDEKLAPRVREIQNRPPMMARIDRTRSEEVASLRIGRCLCSWLGINRKAANTAGMVLVFIHLRSYNAKSRRRRWRPWRKANQALMRALFAQLALWRVETMKSLSSS
ncbi:hypothetical protein BWU74_31350 [Paraburkholderia caledonica]|nr:hypothetical protein BWU74_31350 [Burkholderia sp. Bk]